MNPSLASRLRLGFAILFALLLAVSLVGVGNLFQVRVDFEDAITNQYEIELEATGMNSAFALEQATIRPPRGGTRPSRAELDTAAAALRAQADSVAELASGTPNVVEALEITLGAEREWRRRVGQPATSGKAVDPELQATLAQAVNRSIEDVREAARAAREEARNSARDDTRNTTILVAIGLAGALVAALLLFSGLINSMRAPLNRLVDGSRRLAGGELSTRVEVGGPVEIRSLGRAFNEMADSLELDARERDRLEQMKDDFVLTVSHELRTPVTVVKGFAEILEAERKSLNGQQREAVGVISDSASQLQHMINDLLDLTRSDAGKLRIDPKLTSARALVIGVGRQMKPDFAKSGQKLSVKVQPRLPKIYADPGRISQVLINLLTNANKYAGEGARITMTARKARDAVEFTVSDEGPGLPPESEGRIFERFWRAESGETRAVGGTGLGLAIAKSLVELHGGEITAESAPGEGARFTFTIPTRAKRSKKREQ